MDNNTNFFNRKEEITNWFHQLKEQIPFVIIDDDKSLNALPNTLKTKLIQTSSTVGLTEELANEAINNLDNQELIMA